MTRSGKILAYGMPLPFDETSESMRAVVSFVLGLV